MVELLSNLYLFKGLARSDIELIDEIAELKSYSPGESVFIQGAVANSLYIIQHGTVSIDQDTDDATAIKVATLGTGSHFGEMALLDSQLRSANATAVTDSDIISISYASINDLLEANPHIAIHFYRELSRFLCSRLRLTTMDLSYARSQNISHF